jgi:hypothetical protein
MAHTQVAQVCSNSFLHFCTVVRELMLGTLVALANALLSFFLALFLASSPNKDGIDGGSIFSTLLEESLGTVGVLGKLVA